MKFNQLPASGFAGDAPGFPLPRVSRMRWEFEEKRRYQVIDETLTELFRERELEIWAESWRTPQAYAWATASWRWASIAEFCRLKTVVELEPDANASLVNHLHRFRDQIGLTPAGLKENGWEIVQDAPAPAADVSGVEQPAPVRRLRAVD